MDEQILDSFRWLDDVEPDLSLDAYHITQAEQPEKKYSFLHPRYKRTRSSTTVSITRETRQQRPTSRSSQTTIDLSGSNWQSHEVPPVPKVPELTSQLRGKAEIVSIRARQMDQQPTSSVDVPEQDSQYVTTSKARASFDQSAKHYLDPEARWKLRIYLANPSNFDEALALGFPALQSSVHSKTPMSRRDQQSIASRSRSFQSIKTTPRKPMSLRTDNPGNVGILLKDEKKEGASSDISRPTSSFYEDSESDLMGPPSPTRTDGQDAFTPNRAEFTQPLTTNLPENDTDLCMGIGGRQMTLRLTLTRPDLRADSSLYQDPVPNSSIMKRIGSIRQSTNNYCVEGNDHSRRVGGSFGEVHDVVDKQKESGLKKFFQRLR